MPASVEHHSNSAGWAATRRLGIHTGCCAICFSPDGEGLATGSLESAGVWDARSSELRHTLPFSGITSIAFSPDCGTLALGSSNKTVVTYDTESWSQRLVLSHSAGVSCLSFSPDSSTLASSSFDGMVRRSSAMPLRIPRHASVGRRSSSASFRCACGT